jgi:hypothetical protein
MVVLLNNQARRVYRGEAETEKSVFVCKRAISRHNILTETGRCVDKENS